MGTCFLAVAVFFSAISIGGTEAAAASNDVTWHKTNPFEANDLHDVAVNNHDIYVAVGDEGTILSSSDAKEWKPALPITKEHLKTLATNGETFVAAGENGTPITSADGVTWTKGKFNKTYTIGEFVSSDSKKEHERSYVIHWKTQMQISFLRINSVIWDGKRYVAIGSWRATTGERKKNSKAADSAASIGGTIVMTSADGRTWDMKSMNAGGSKIVFSGKKYAILSGRTISLSTDLVNWKDYFPDALKSRSAFSFSDMIFANGIFMAIGWDGNISARTGAIYTSTDGIKWKEIINKKDIGTGLVNEKYGKPNGFSDLDMNTILWDGKQYWIAGYKGMLLHSANGSEWDKWSEWYDDHFQPFDYQNQAGKQANINKMIYDGERYIQVGNRGTIIVSEKLTNAEVVRQRPATDFRYIGFDGKDRYVASGKEGEIFESADGYDWKPIDLDWPSPLFHWKGLAAGNGSALIVGRMQTGPFAFNQGDAEYYYSSAPGVWEKKKFPVKLSTAYKVAFTNGKFFVFGREGYITSADGINWSKLTPLKPAMNNIVSNGKIYLGQAAWVPETQGTVTENEIYTSSDGLKWKKLSITLNKVKYKMIAEDLLWNGKQFVTVGARLVPEQNGEVQNVVAFSVDGLSWTVKKDEMSFQNLAWNGKQYVAAHKDGLYYSNDAIRYKASPVLTKHPMSTVIWDGDKFIAVGDGATMLVSKKPPTPAKLWEENKEKFNLKVDPNEHMIVEPDPDAVAFHAEAQKRIDSVKQIGIQYGFEITDNETADSWICWLNQIESMVYETFKSGDKRNKLSYYVYFNGIDEKLLNTTKEIIEQHTGASKEDVKTSLKSVIEGKKDATGSFEINEVHIQYSLSLKESGNGNGTYGELVIWY